jgi:hypothetical protein
MKFTSRRRSSDAAASAAGSQLQPGQRVDRDDVRRDAADVADHRVGPRLGEQVADAVAQPGQVCPGERAADREGDRLRLGGSHLPVETSASREIQR